MEKLKKFRVSFNAPVTLSFIILCLIATILGVVSKGALSSLLFTTWRLQLLNPLSILRCFSHVIGHANFDHFFNNMLFIVILGPMLEEKYGSKTMILLILLTGFATTMAITLLFPNSGVIGASGVVFAMILLSSYTSFEEGTIPLTFILVFVIYIGREVINGVFVNDNISQLGHIVGGCVGSLIGFVFNRKKRAKTDEPDSE